MIALTIWAKFQHSVVKFLAQMFSCGDFKSLSKNFFDQLLFQFCSKYAMSQSDKIMLTADLFNCVCDTNGTQQPDNYSYSKSRDDISKHEKRLTGRRSHSNKNWCYMANSCIVYWRIICFVGSNPHFTLAMIALCYFALTAYLSSRDSTRFFLLTEGTTRHCSHTVPLPLS